MLLFNLSQGLSIFFKYYFLTLRQKAYLGLLEAKNEEKVKYFFSFDQVKKQKYFFYKFRIVLLLRIFRRKKLILKVPVIFRKWHLCCEIRLFFGLIK